jgi:hypothetical protein
MFIGCHLIQSQPLDSVARVHNHLPKEPNITRLHFQNINGVSLRNGGTWELVCDHYKQMEVDIALACEHKVDTTHKTNLATMRAHATKLLGQGTFTLEAASTPSQARRWETKSGGTLAMAIGPTKGRIASTYSDDAGRWVAITLLRQHRPNLTCICTYQVVDVNPTTVGEGTYANQLLGYYKMQNRTHPRDLRKHHSNDLLLFVKQCQREGHSVLVAGDFNETLGDAFGGMSRLVSDCGLFDVVADRHGQVGFSTYQRGTKVLDYCLMTQDLIDCVDKCGYEPFKCNILSDHRGLFVDFSTAHLFGNTILPLQPVVLRDISSSKPYQTAPYFEHKDKYLTTVGWYEDLVSISQSIQTGTPNHILAERLYQQLASACKEAGSMLKRYPPAPYSPEIVKLRNILCLMKLTVTSYSLPSTTWMKQ